MGKLLPKSLSFLRGFSLCLYVCVYLALAGQSSCSGSGTKTFGNTPGSNSSSSSGASNAVASASFDGLVSSSSVGYRSVSLTYGNSVGAVSLNVYCKVGLNASTYTLVGALANTVSTGGSGTLSNLSSGTTHTCYALAVNAAGVETPLASGATPITVSFQTLSYLQNSYRNVAIAKAYGDTVNPVTSPTNRMVSITWVPISDASLSGMTYRVFRTRKGVTPNLDSTTANTNCAQDTSTNTATCKVNCATGSSLGVMGTALTCIDTSVATAPSRYWYFISLVPSSTAGTLHYEEPPSVPTTLASVTPAVSSDAYFVDVPIPPDEMVLVHRESVNYEFCQLIGRTSTDLAYIDGRVTSSGAAVPGRGVLYKNRCLFGTSLNSAPGSLPTNSNPFTSPIAFPTPTDAKGYYDFGYNLFIDRWELGCNWSPAQGTLLPDGSTGTGMCSTGGATAQSCFGGVTTSTNGNPVYFTTTTQGIVGTSIAGPTAPANTIGTDGNVYWDANVLGMCWLNDGGTWKATGYDPTISLSKLSKAFTVKPFNDPTVQANHFVRPPAHFRTQTTAARACQSQTASGYSVQKRLLRHREFVASAAWASNSIDPYNPSALSGAQLSAVSTNVNASFLPRTVAGSCHNPIAAPVAGNTANYDRGNHGDSLYGKGPLDHISLFYFNMVPPSPNPTPSAGAYFATGLSVGAPNYGYAYGVGPYTIGSPWSRNCVSRYGAQDLIGNMGEWSSDQYSCSGSGTSFTCGAVNDGSNFFDNGADLVTQFNDGIAPRPSPTTTQGHSIWSLQGYDWSNLGPFGFNANWGGGGNSGTYAYYTGNTSCILGTLSGCGKSLANFNHWFWGNPSSFGASLNQLNGIHFGLGYPMPIDPSLPSQPGCDSTGKCPVSSSLLTSIDPQFRGFSMDSRTSAFSTLAPINGGANPGGLYAGAPLWAWPTWSFDMINGTAFNFNPSRYNTTLYSAEGTRLPGASTGNSPHFQTGIPIDSAQSPFTGARCGFSPD